MISQIELLSHKWLSFMVSSSLQLTIFLMIVLFISFLMRKQSASFLYILWLSGLFKVFIPPEIKLPTFLSESSLGQGLHKGLTFLTIPEINSTILNKTTFSYQSILFIVWLAVVIGISGWWIYRYITFSYLIRRSKPFKLQDVALFSRVNVPIYSNSQVKMAFTRGIFSPKIYLPSQALSWPEGELKAIILHEWAHVKRKDTFFIALQNFIQIVYFFHPLVWFANLQISRYREKACDDFAIKTMQCRSLEYSKYLLNSINRIVRWQPLPVVTNYFHQSSKFIIKRFEYILNRKENVMIKLNLFQKIVLTAVIVVAVGLSCQTGKRLLVPRAPADNKLLSTYDDAPQPVGGIVELQKNLVYPESARKAGIEGRVVVNFQIDENGTVTDAKIVQSLDKSCDEAAIKALKSVYWKPALKDNKPVKAWITMPLVFRLHHEKQKESPLKEIKTKNDAIMFAKYDEPPMPVGGLAAIQQNLRYPEISRKAGIEGKVILRVQIDEQGKVRATEVVQSLGSNNGCDEAAINAVKSVSWIPAKYKGKPVAVWVVIPLVFRLNH